MHFTYSSGEEIKMGDRIRYHNEPGEVAFVIYRSIGDPIQDWYLAQYPNGGFMLDVSNLGSIFLTDSDEDLEFISRADDSLYHRE